MADHKPVKDPFPTPIALEPVTEEAKVQIKQFEAFLFPDRDLSGVTILFTTPAKYQKNVIGAEPLAVCEKCKQEVWISPSSMKTFQTATVVCLDCLLKATQEWEQSKHEEKTYH